MITKQNLTEILVGNRMVKALPQDPSEPGLIAQTIRAVGVFPRRMHIATWQYRDYVREFDGKNWAIFQPHYWEAHVRSQQLEQNQQEQPS